MTVYSHDKIKPWLKGQLGVLVAEYLEAEGVVAGAIARLLDRLAIEASDEAIQSTEHSVGWPGTSNGLL